MIEVRQPIVTIIIPAYNAEKYIAQTIDSVIAQSVKEWELIIVDDGSMDSTRQIVEKYIYRDLRIKLLIQKTNLGVSKARNRGLRVARGLYVSFLDSDDVYSKFYIEKMLKTYRKYPEVSVVFCGYRQFHNVQEIEALDLRGGVGCPINFINYISKVKKAYVGMAFMYKKKDLKTKKIFFHEQTSNFEDIEFLLRATYSEQVAYISAPLYFYRWHNESVSNQPIQKKQIISVISTCRRLKDYFLSNNSAYSNYVDHLENSYNNYVKRYIWKLILTKRFEEAEKILNVYVKDLRQPFDVQSKGLKKILNYPKLKIIRTRNPKIWKFAHAYLRFL